MLNFNFCYPTLLGLKFLIYKNKYLRNNYYVFDVKNDIIDLINKTIVTIPYYRHNYKSLRIKTLSDLKSNIGFIDKELVMTHWEDFQLPGDYTKKTIHGTTGGTSGKPLHLVLPKNRFIFELATMYTMWENVDWKGHTRAVIRNHRLEENKVYKVDWLKKEVIFDGFRTSEEYYNQIYNIIKKNKIRYIHAYPSSAYQFALFLSRSKLDFSFIRAFFCGSEALLPEQKELIQNQLGIAIYHWYGHSEKLVLGGYCKSTELIHIEPTYGYFELVDETGNPVIEVGKIGEIVGTTLHNKFMPLIRYRTGDYAEYAGNYCPYCKRHLPLLKTIYGRWDKNKIYRNDGSYISTTALNLHSELYNKIDGLQYYQEKKGTLEVRIIKGQNFSINDEKLLYQHFQTSFGENNTVYVRYVTSLEKLPNGKFQNLISQIK